MKKVARLVAAALWVAAGGMLLFRGGGFLFDKSTAGALGKTIAIALGGYLGYLKGTFVLARSARRGKARIEAAESPHPLSAFTPKFALLIGLMIGFGRGLQWLAEQGWMGWVSVGGIYVGIGAALLASAPVYLRRESEPMDTTPGKGADPLPNKRGVLLVNLGTPAEASRPAIRRYLREFLSDPKVVDAPWLLWRIVLNVIVIPKRLGAVTEAYQKIWTEGGSPLMVYTQASARALRERLGVPVEVAMRYGSPSLTEGLEALRREGCGEVLVQSLFPQASDTTSGTVQLAVAKAAAQRPDPQSLHILPAFPDDPGYLNAVATRVRETRSSGSGAVDRIVFSFHGLPERYVRQGDPYLDHCQRTARGLAAQLELDEDAWEMAFQSRFGDEPWLQPYLDERLRTLAKEGSRRVMVVLPGFAADCLETLEEVAIGLQEEFEAAGGEELLVVPALNDHPAWIDALERILRERLVAVTGLEPVTPGL